MAIYRFYTIKKDGHISGPAAQHNLPDDAAAMSKARELLVGEDIEVWLDTRVVGYLTAGTEPTASQSPPVRVTSRF